MKRWFNFPVSVEAFVRVSSSRDREVATILRIALESEFSGHLYMSRRYYLFLECFCRFTSGESRILIQLTQTEFISPQAGRPTTRQTNTPKIAAMVGQLAFEMEWTCNFRKLFLTFCLP
jgi:hypothetical protein